MNKSNLANINWWWQLGSREGWTPYSMTRFGWEVNIKSIQDEGESSKWVVSVFNVKYKEVYVVLTNSF